MPSYRCVVDVDLQAVSAPGVWLPNKENVYLSITMFGQTKYSRFLTSIFPLLVNEHFVFERVYLSALDKSHVVEALRDEVVTIELLQLARYSDTGIKLASYSTSVKDFLYPYTSWPSTRLSNRKEIVMSRTIAYTGGLCPKLELSTAVLLDIEGPIVPVPAVDPFPVYSRPRYVIEDDLLDREVLQLTRPAPVYRPVRPRTAISPVSYRAPSYRDASYSDASYRDTSYRDGSYRDTLLARRPYTPTYLDRLTELEVERTRAARLASAYRSYSKSIDDLTKDLGYTRIRRY